MPRKRAEKTVECPECRVATKVLLRGEASSLPKNFAPQGVIGRVAANEKSRGGPQDEVSVVRRGAKVLGKNLPGAALR